MSKNTTSLSEAINFTLEMMETANFNWFQVVKEISVTNPEAVFNAMKMVKSGTTSFYEYEAIRLIRNNQMVPAIKFIRENTGMGLKEAKDYAERLRDDLKASGQMS